MLDEDLRQRFVVMQRLAGKHDMNELRFFVFLSFTGFPAGTVKIRGHQQLQQKISNLSVLVASQMDITSYHFGRFKESPRETF